MGKESGSGMNILHHFSESLKILEKSRTPVVLFLTLVIQLRNLD
jgi:hypothetical protein